jgi:hypothetical protein
MIISRRHILVLIIDWLAPMRSRFALWGESPGFCLVHHTKTRGLPARYGWPSHEVHAEHAGMLRLAS